MANTAATHCKECGIELEGSNIVWATPLSKQALCRTCYNTSCRERYHKLKTPKTLEKNRRYSLINKYGLTIEEYDKLNEFQQGGCAICRQPQTGKRLSVDHNHKTGEVRGLLCHSCNIMVGNSKEDENIIWNMLEYLKRHNKKSEVA